MVKSNNTANGQRKQAAKRAKRANGGNEERLVRITAETTYGECKERLTAFGGLLAIPSRSFQAHHVFFQIVMLAYNLWRWMKMLAGHAAHEQRAGRDVPESPHISLPDHTIGIARLKMRFVAAKIRFHNNRDEVRYSIYEQRAAGLIGFLTYVDRRRRLAA